MVIASSSYTVCIASKRARRGHRWMSVGDGRDPSIAKLDKWLAEVEKTLALSAVQVGVDVGFTTGSVIVWGVFTDTNRFAGMLTGTYVGATAQATAVAGVGANALVGGSNHSVALQPLSVQGQVGLNAAGGIGALDLHYAQ
jgi:uncharacterized protein DUF992